MQEPRIGRLNARWVVTWRDANGKRSRHRLKANTKQAAEAEGRDIFRRETAGASGHLISDLFRLYQAEKSGRTIATQAGYSAAALAPTFGSLRPDQVTIEDSRTHTSARKSAGIAPGTIWTELGHLRIVMNWARRHGLIDRVPVIEIPPKPAPKDRYLNDSEISQLMAADAEPHVRLAIILMLSTAARVGAILELTWDRVDFGRSIIDLRVDAEGPRKGRAVVPMTETVRAVLARQADLALSDYVVEWASGPVKSIRTGFSSAVRNAGLKGVTPHVLRHTAGVRMAAAGIPMQKISQFMGHSNTSVTERVYARYAPGHMKDAAAALEFGSLRIVK